jgi:hypothetical protein
MKPVDEGHAPARSPAPPVHYGSRPPTPALQGLARLAAFGVLLIAMAFALDRGITHGLRTIPTSTFGVWNRIVDGQINADILVTGSSRAVNHYDPALIQSATGRTTYNIGLNGSQIDMQVARLRTYLAHNRKPKLIIHNLDLSTFLVSHGEVYDPGQYIPYLQEETLFASLRQIEPQFWKARALPLYGYVVEDLRFTWIIGIRSLLGHVPPEDHPLGFNPRHLRWTSEFDQFHKLHSEGVRIEIEPDGVRHMQDLLRLCRNQGIELVLVYSPEYREMQDLTLNRAEVFAKFRELGQAYGVPFWDYSDSWVSADRNKFYNSQHLNAAGAEDFSRLLADRIASML